jgi:transposase-like protein
MSYAQDLNRACLAFLRAEQAEARSANIANGARTRMGHPVRARALSPIQELAQRVLRHADPFTLPDDAPEQTEQTDTTPTKATPTKAPMHTLTVDPTNTKIKTRKVHSHTDKERARAMHANGARFTDIARELGVSNSTLSYWLLKPASQSASQPTSQSTSQPAPVEPVSAEPVSAEPAPVEPVSTEPAPVEPAPVEPVSAEPAHTQLQEISEQIRALSEKREALLAPLRAEREALLTRLAYLETLLK